MSLEAATYTDNQPKIAPILDRTKPVIQRSPHRIKAIQDKLNFSVLPGDNAIAPFRGRKKRPKDKND